LALNLLQHNKLTTCTPRSCIRRLPPANEAWKASAEDRQQVLLIARAISSRCDSHSDKCQAICEAASQLKNASDDLSRCAANVDYNDSCDSKFRQVRDAHDELESAVSDAAGDCN